MYQVTIKGKGAMVDAFREKGSSLHLVITHQIL